MSDQRPRTRAPPWDAVVLPRPQVSVEGTANLLEEVRRESAVSSVVFASSMAVYGCGAAGRGGGRGALGGFAPDMRLGTSLTKMLFCVFVASLCVLVSHGYHPKGHLYHLCHMNKYFFVCNEVVMRSKFLPAFLGQQPRRRGSGTP